MSLSNISTVIYKNKRLSNGRYAIRLRLYFGVEHYISLGESALPSEWNERNGRFTSKAENYESRNAFLVKKEKEARDIFNKMDTFEFNEFRNQFKGAVAVNTFVSVQEFLEKYISEWKSKGKIGSMNKYRQLQQMISNFQFSQLTKSERKKGKENVELKSLKFSDINYNWLKEFEAYIFSRGNGDSTVHFYMRHLRSTCNEAIDRGLATVEDYAFKGSKNPKAKYTIARLKGKDNPKPLSPATVKKLWEFNAIKDQHPKIAPWYDLYMFLFLSRGMSFIDAIKLRYSKHIKHSQNEKGENEVRIKYERVKSDNYLDIKLSPLHLQIMDRYRVDGSDYVFPYEELAPTDPTEMYKYERLILRLMNKYMVRLGEMLELPASEKITSYTSKYTYVDMLVVSGAPAHIIQQALAHTTITTSQGYISRRATAVIDAVDESIFKFE